MKQELKESKNLVDVHLERIGELSDKLSTYVFSFSSFFSSHIDITYISIINPLRLLLSEKTLAKAKERISQLYVVSRILL